MNITKRYTIKQVANIAGVSTQTISRVINNRSDVAVETRAHIEHIIKKLNYQPSALARSLISQRSFTLGVVTAGLRFSGPSCTLNGIAGKADELGYTILLKELPRFDSYHAAESLLDTLIAWPVDGIIWAAPEVGNNRAWVDKRLAGIKAPVVFLNMESRPGLSIINDDNFHGAKTATTHLLEQGYQRIAHLSGPLDWWESRQRKAGWEQGLAEAGITALASHSVAGDWTPASVELAFQQLQRQYADMDAVFVANDQMALGVIQSLSRQGISIPQQLGVVGFDGLAEAAYYSPALTTVAQDHALLGCKAVEEIVSAIEHLHTEDALPAPRTMLVQSELVVRKSSIRQPVIETGLLHQ